jgi:hypothetical protein
LSVAFASKRFEIVRPLGEGGMGIVYEARDRELGGRVALKTLRNASVEHLSRLKREFRAMQDVQHPNLVTLRELVCEDDHWFLTMDLIDGVDFLTHVRSSAAAVLADPGGSGVVDRASPTLSNVPRLGAEAPLFDDARLRAAMRKLTEGLLALHAAGMVHRDIKPSNVLVTREGRVVILDFGLVAERAADASTLAMAGTPSYMAPEQAVAAEVGPAADWYAVGALLYQALTGRVPFEGTAMQVMMRKQVETAIPASAIGVGVPADLDALCAALLRFDPGERPSGGAVLRQLGGVMRASAEASVSGSRTLTPGFVGRAKDLALLVQSLRDSRAEGTAVVIEGESGVGKSRLVRRFTEQIALEDPETVVLAGRCYERESVPYKAFDGVVDAYARLLARMSELDARVFMPGRPAPLAQVFPVLQRVPAFADAARKPGPELDPLELRRRAFAALRETLLRMSEQRAMVVVVDDAQWADDDSYALLTELTRPPEPPRILLVATVRSGAASAEAVLARPEEGVVARLRRAIGMEVRHIALGPLSPEEARELASELVGRTGSERPPGADIDAIAAEARGHPLFIDVLARQTARAEGATPTRLEDALGQELAALDVDARRIIETVALADAPLAQRVVERATAIVPDPYVRAVHRLRISRLVVTTGARGDDRIEPYHDRVRAAVFATLTGTRRAELHRAIARALEAERDADPEALAMHWKEAGENEQAARFSVLAGDRAVQALAFDRAASLYQQALTLGGESAALRRQLYVKLGDALANAGRGERAARAYEQAVTGAMAADALDLRQRAAVQLLRGGHWEEGIASIRGALETVGVWLPRTPFQALLQLVFLRVLVNLRSLRFDERDASEVARSELTRIDTCRLAAAAIGMVEVIRGLALQSRELLLALRCGEPVRVVRALAQEVGMLAIDGGSTYERTGKLLSRIEPLAARTGDPFALALTAAARALRSFLSGHFTEGRANSDDATTRFRECPGAYWEADVTTRFALESLFYRGDLRELVQRWPGALSEAKARGNVFAWVSLSGGAPGLSPLVADDAARVRAHVAEATAAWSRTSYDLTHYYGLYALVGVDLYEGNGRAALAKMGAEWGALRRSLLLRVQIVRIVMWHCRARAALAMAHGDPSNRVACARAAERDASLIERERMAWATPLARLIRAGVARSRGDEGRAVALLRESVTGFEAAEMTMHAAVARRALGVHVAGDEGRALVAEADAWFQSQGVKRPDAFMAMLAPGTGER